MIKTSPLYCLYVFKIAKISISANEKTRCDEDMNRCTFPKLHLYAAMTSCRCLLLLDVTKSNMASLSLPEEHKATASTKSVSLTETDATATIALLNTS